MATKALPRGIQSTTWQNKDGTQTTKFRVRITRKDFKGKRNQYFDELKEAASYLALSKLTKGKELIYSITEEERIKKELEKRESSNDDFSLGYFIDCYIKDYVLSKPVETELHQRTRNHKLSTYKTIKKTSILDRSITYDEKLEFGVDDNLPTFKFMHSYDVRKIKPIDINLYIKERLKTIKPISVQRELTMLSNVFNKLIYFNESLENVVNPLKSYDRDLLRNTVTKREFSITPDDEKKLFEVVKNYSNKEMFDICKMSLLTSMRKAECVTLKPEQIKDRYIQLTISKSGKPRKIYFDEPTKLYLNSITPYSKTKFFKYTIGGFDRVFRNVMSKNDLGHIHFHDLRRLKISRTLSQIGAENSVFVAEFLGFSNVSKMIELHSDPQANEPTNQKGYLNNFGHSNADVTKKHYFNFDFNVKDKINELKAKKKDGSISPTEEKDLLDLLVKMSDL